MLRIPHRHIAGQAGYRSELRVAQVVVAERRSQAPRQRGRCGVQASGGGLRGWAVLRGAVGADRRANGGSTVSDSNLVEHAGIRRALDRGEIGRLLGEQLLDPAGKGEGQDLTGSGPALAKVCAVPRGTHRNPPAATWTRRSSNCASSLPATTAGLAPDPRPRPPRRIGRCRPRRSRRFGDGLCSLRHCEEDDEGCRRGSAGRALPRR